MLTEKNLARDYPLAIKFLLACGAIGPLLFIIVFLIEGATRPGYSAWRDFVSDLGLSNQGWMQVANFLVCGLLTLGCAVGLRLVLRTGKGSVGGPLLLGMFSMGLIMAGLFTTDPNLGYPPGSPTNGHQTLHGTLHGIAGIIVFFSVGIASLIMARRFAGDPRWKGWAAYSILTGIVVIVFFIASTVASVLDATGTLPNSPTGLLQRIAIIVGWGWVALLAIQLLRRRAPA
ncbi:MAG TPA: DUF998 domain-containing protein [Ktedonobacteraceae bacterium]|nr:DUF998 domain-containing protein [Ktedonobacteraceae bacterium]